MTKPFFLKAIPASIMMASLALSQVAAAQGSPEAGPNPLQQSVVKGLANSPALSGDVYALEAQMEEANAAFGGMLPTVDLRGQVGRERSKTEGTPSRTYNTDSYGIEARQNLFNGFASQARYYAAHANAMQSYFRYLNKANQVAFEASNAHIDVSRNQALIKLAEANLKYHTELMTRIEEKVKSGVSRESDLEQARSRYTLAMSNLATEKANTFAAMANYQRITDSVWPINEAGEYVVQANFEVENTERLVFALNNHPLLKAANAQIESSKNTVTAASEGFYPRFDLRAKSDYYSNYLSTFADRQISSIDLLASMNLYRGGSDSALRKAAVMRKNQSMDDKVAVCRSIRQSSQSALYDVVNLQKKVNYFKLQADAITKARAAYEQQFNVGRRSLLDLLSAENEYFQAQRALINVEADLSIAKLRLLAATGQLVGLFGVDELVKATEPAKRQVLFYKQASNPGVDGEGCPAELINLDAFKLPTIGFDDDFKNVKADPLEFKTAPDSAGVQDTAAPTTVAAPASGGYADPAKVSQGIIDRTNEWAKAWEARDVNAYIGFYSPSFKPERGSYESWEAGRRDRLRTATGISVNLTDVQVVPSFDDPTTYEVNFVQNYRANNYRETSKKTLTWKLVNGKWLIVRERNSTTTRAGEQKASNDVEATDKTAG